MAIENRVYLKGLIVDYKKYRKDNEIIKIDISLLVARRPNTSPEVKAGDLKKDKIKVNVREERMIKYLEENNAAVNDFLFVSGVFCTLNAKRIFICQSCKTRNAVDGTVTFVHPLCLDLHELYPKHTEIIPLTDTERRKPTEDILSILKRRKTNQGNIISIKDLEQKDSNGNHLIRITVRKEITENDINNELRRGAEVSNRITIMGNLCDDPIYTPKEEGGRTCSYQLGIDRKVYIKPDDPEIISDYPWIKSLGDQADSDKNALMKGSLVYVDGSIQARDDYKIEKYCENCHEKNRFMGDTMEIVPYAVEYLRNCMTGEEYEFDDEYEDDEMEGED